MRNELLSIGPFTVYGYGFMIAIGIIVAYVIAEYRARKLNMEYEQILPMVLYCVIGGFCGAKLLFWLTEWKEIIESPSVILYTLSDGFVVYGGIIGGILTGYFFCKYHKLSFWEYFDLVMPSVALAQGFGRMGCLLAGCCYGKETAGKLAIVFPENGYSPAGIPLIPTQIYSSILNFIHFIVLLFIARYKKQNGQVAACYLILYSTGRFILEFFRGDLARGNVGILSTSQFISIFIAIAGLILFLHLNRNKQK